MIFNGIEKEYIVVTTGRIRPFFAPLSRDVRFDSKLVKTDRGHRIIEVPVYIKYNSKQEFRTLTEDIAGWLVHDEPKELIFKDEPDRVYFALIDDTVNEDFLYNQGTSAILKFICGYKYSHEKQLTTPILQNIEGHKS